MESFQRVIQEIARERERQDAKWGEVHDSRLGMQDWLDILRDELGEAQTAPRDNAYLTELVHVAAVAVAALQHYGVPHA